jgi:hypothetical protein
MGHTLMENRNGLIVAATMTTATGTAERKAAEEMIVRHSPGAGRITLGADKGYDAASFVADMRALNVTPHIAQYISGLGINILIGYFARNGVLDRTWGRSISRFSGRSNELHPQLPSDGLRCARERAERHEFVFGIEQPIQLSDGGVPWARCA